VTPDDTGGHNERISSGSEGGRQPLTAAGDRRLARAALLATDRRPALTLNDDPNGTVLLKNLPSSWKK
jgi:hypothetical protein